MCSTIFLLSWSTFEVQVTSFTFFSSFRPWTSQKGSKKGYAGYVFRKALLLFNYSNWILTIETMSNGMSSLEGGPGKQSMSLADRVWSWNKRGGEVHRLESANVCVRDLTRPFACLLRKSTVSVPAVEVYSMSMHADVCRGLLQLLGTMSRKMREEAVGLGCMAVDSTPSWPSAKSLYFLAPQSCPWSVAPGKRPNLQNMVLSPTCDKQV